METKIDQKLEDSIREYNAENWDEMSKEQMVEKLGEYSRRWVKYIKKEQEEQNPEYAAYKAKLQQEREELEDLIKTYNNEKWDKMTAREMLQKLEEYSRYVGLEKPACNEVVRWMELIEERFKELTDAIQ
jgi:methionyl-tRNA synthetase